MRILQISGSDSEGGSAQVAKVLFESYRERGHHSLLAVGSSMSHDDDDVVLLPRDQARGRWARWCNSSADAVADLRGRMRGAQRLAGTLRAAGEPARWLEVQRGHEDFDFPGSHAVLDLVPTGSGVVHAHNLHWEGAEGRGYFDLRLLPALSHRTPTFLTLHDAWLLSGHCAHSFGCDRWTTGCGACPDLSIYPSVRRDATDHNWSRKREIYRRSRLRVATPSRWLMQRVERSMLAEGILEAKVIPNGLDPTVFHAQDRREARRLVGLAEDETVVLVLGSFFRGDPWRDPAALRAAVEACAETATVIAVGGERDAYPAGAAVQSVPTQTREGLATYLRAADVYLHPARADTFPTAVIEALACGAAVAGTAVGGIPEQVIDGVTGVLTEAGAPSKFAEAVRELVGDRARTAAFGAAAAEDARRRFQLDSQVDAYLDWYAAALSAVP
jgi:glycosyltransferase involved in cell wall biosynthesis